MVSLTTVIASNRLISSTISSGLVAVFVGATSGIGEITLKKFAQYTRQPRAYFIGRSQDAADRIVADCKGLNPDGEYIFIKADVSLIRVVDEVCDEIKAKETSLNILFLSVGVPSFDRSETSENLHLLAALNYYSRLRFISNLLPLLRASSSRTLRRIITVGGGTHEGLLDTSDFSALRVPLSQLRGHLTTLITLGLEALARTAPDVTFIHDYPGTVKTPFLNYLSAEQLQIYADQMVEVDESGERHFYLATSARFPPRVNSEIENETVPLGNGALVAVGTDGAVGSGVYSVDKEGESAGADVLDLLKKLREERMVETVWRHTVGEFERITGVDRKM